MCVPYPAIKQFIINDIQVEVIDNSAESSPNDSRWHMPISCDTINYNERWQERHVYAMALLDLKFSSSTVLPLKDTENY